MEPSKTNRDFEGWVTKAGLLCSDGRTILPDAFKHCDGKVVPLVWNHQHDSVFNVLGKIRLENRPEGVYGYGLFNDTEAGNAGRSVVEHGDVASLSIYANRLKHTPERGVLHGDIKEVSLVLAGANPGAFINSYIKHGEDSDEYSEDEGIFYSGLDDAIESFIQHAEDEDNDKETKEETEMAEEKKTNGEKTVKDIWDSMTEEQQTVVYAMIGQALEDNSAQHNFEDEEDNTMKYNIFENDEQQDDVLTHSDIQAIFSDAKRYGSLKDSVLAHTDGEIEYAANTQDYGINGTDFLFPEARLLNSPPEFIKREMGWVTKVMHGVHHTPFSRIKSMFADITEDDARAKGYIKGNYKKEEVFGLLRRTTTPTTIYKKQKMDRDDIIDITDFDVVAWLKSEMRMMLDEEIARAILVGDGRSAASEDKINEGNIRPVWTDDDLFTIKVLLELAAGTDESERARQFIRHVIKARKDYKGSGDPTLFTTEDFLTDCLLMEDRVGHRLYKSPAELATALRVKDIVTVPVMENLTRDVNGKTHHLMGLMVNLKDYNVGADKGGAVNMFDDFDIDYNAQKYLIETRCSGALTKPFSAMAIEYVETAAAE